MKAVNKKKPQLNSRLKKVGLLFLLIPIGFLLLFLFGEIIGGDISGLGHLIQVIPLLFLGYLAIKFPYIGGVIIIAVGVALSILYSLLTGITYIMVDILLFLPLIISGVLLVISSRPK